MTGSCESGSHGPVGILNACEGIPPQPFAGGFTDLRGELGYSSILKHSLHVTPQMMIRDGNRVGIAP